MALDSAKIITRSTSDLLNIEMIANNTSLSTTARMAAIADICDAWDYATTGAKAPTRAAANLEWRAAKRQGKLYGPLR